MFSTRQLMSMYVKIVSTITQLSLYSDYEKQLKYLAYSNIQWVTVPRKHVTLCTSDFCLLCKQSLAQGHEYILMSTKHGGKLQVLISGAMKNPHLFSMYPK